MDISSPQQRLFIKLSMVPLSICILNEHVQQSQPDKLCMKTVWQVSILKNPTNIDFYAIMFKCLLL